MRDGLAGIDTDVLLMGLHRKHISTVNTLLMLSKLNEETGRRRPSLKKTYLIMCPANVYLHNFNLQVKIIRLS